MNSFLDFKKHYARNWIIKGWILIDWLIVCGLAFLIRIFQYNIYKNLTECQWRDLYSMLSA